MADFFSIFFLYSFLGFLVEVGYTQLCRHAKKDRKCLLFLPLCPVYGLGAAAVLSMPGFILARPLLVFVAGALVSTLVEYGVALFYEWGVGVRFWSYDQQPGNLSGRICPLYTLFWGGLSLLTVYGFQPLLPPCWLGFPSGSSGGFSWPSPQMASSRCACFSKRAPPTALLVSPAPAARPRKESM